MADYYAIPADANEWTPSVVLAMHIFGVDRHIRDSADRLAVAGFATVVPDLYDSLGAPDGDVENDYRKFIPFAQQLTFETVDPRITGAAKWLRDRFPGTKTAIAGLCMGGIIVLRRSYGYSAVFDAAAIWYGAIGDTEPTRVDIPIVGSFGGSDAGIPLSTVESFRARLSVANDVVIYPSAGHAFCDETRPSFDAEASRDSWRRTIEFLGERLAAS
jgi:carboxymethylenebutenolidase